MRKKFSLFFGVLFLGGVLAAAALAYDNVTIHPDLSQAAVSVYKNQASSTLTAEQTQWIIQGSQDEDADPRYTNHYYDPTTGKGLTDLSEVPDIIQSTLTFNSARDWLWRQDSGSGDYSVPAILDNYARGNTRIAYLGVGHIIHLFQDMAVPAHTRNDSHAMGDPLEQWARVNGTINLNNVSFQPVGDLNKAFDKLALYSHNNFFSKDTVSTEQLKKLKTKIEVVNGVTKKYLLSSVNGKEIRIAVADSPDALFPIYLVNDDLKLNIDYWNMLYPKAVGYSAGVIEYFVKEFAKIDKQKAMVKLTPEQKIVQAVNVLDANMMYGLGDIWSSVVFNAQQTYVTGRELTQTIGAQLGYFTDANKELAVNALNQATVLGVKVVSNLKNPITAANLFKLQPADAQTIITYNPVASSSNGATGQVTVVMTGTTTRASQIWVFTIGTSTASTTPPKATTTPPDMTPPTATINPLEAEYAQIGFEVNWQGSDVASGTAEVSGLAGFDLEYRLNNNEWQSWFTATSATSSFFNQTATSGDVILFRVRATDRTGNIGTWSEAQTKITILPPPAPLCSLPEPAFSGVYTTRTAIADKTSAASSTPDENVFIVDISGDDQGFQLFTRAPACGLQSISAWGDTWPGSRLIVELGYDPDTKLFNGKYRFCTDGWNVNKISGDRCLDGSWWSDSRWFGDGYLVGSSEVLIKNSASYLPWLKIE